MALTPDVQLENRGAGGGDSFSGPNVAVGATVVVVTVSLCSSSSTTGPDPITVTYDGASMTQFGSTLLSNAVAGMSAEAVFYLLAPPSGVKTVVVSWTNTVTSNDYTNVKSYTGGDTTTPLANLSTATATSGTALTVTQSPSAPTGDLIQSAMGQSSSLNIITSTSDDNGGSQDYLDNTGACSSAGRSSGSGGTTFTYSSSGAFVNATAISVTIKAPAAGAAGNPYYAYQQQ